MKLAKFVIATALLSSSACACACAVQPEHYLAYEAKVKSCVEIEKRKPAISLEQLIGLPREAVAKGVFYYKAKNLVDCSAKEELYSLAQALVFNDSSDIDMAALTYMYLSIALVGKESDFNQVPSNVRNKIEKALQNRNLEVNLVSLYDKLGTMK
ncbi:MAG: hypothetical protein COA76_14635 [Moritella sp.]|uniref:hypothetical protein n=1 Tax=Moritella sp. TaxID=78556 RepID=UPI000C121D2D|nr:hypothetical protein [Moritella sp.]MBL1415835.1 hypothetical protein [Moritella sp.]PHR86603.1 MAG: hypothetical protein COA76_14635 [Moritella sp.]